MKYRPFFPTAMICTGEPASCSTYWAARLVILPGRGPARPRLGETRITAVFFTGLTCSSAGVSPSVLTPARSARMLSMLCTNGRLAMTCSCARRSRDAATVSMALVICATLRTERIRRRISLSDAMAAYASAGDALARPLAVIVISPRMVRDCGLAFTLSGLALPPFLKRRGPFEFLDGGTQLLFRFGGDGFLSGDALANLGMAGIHEAIERLLEGLDLVHVDVIEVAIDAGEDDHDLLLERKGSVLALLQQLG